MSNNLEDFISNNREEFDDKVPPKQLWENIEAAVTGKKKHKILMMPVINWVLATAAMITVGIFIYMQFDKKPASTPAIATTDTVTDRTMAEAPQVNEFARLITMKQEELKVLAKEQPQLYRKFTTDITQLDSSYNALKKQLSGSPNKELLIEALIQNLQLQLNVLNQQLNIIKQIKQTKKYSHEKNYQTI